ncbi:alpha/beta hydrolase family protein [Roseivivax isoporae]|uniref:Dienelactone hydrolase n=1 Tax=Roseivivax isoporae LMG 25204 TaxID=1449351 RepID=X7FBJ6_9RHOB|nr:alpha/beta fold hydrolase [Roseivivax isoporae]ETX30073.1 dienelactone hydrolase [Roseivivax isoporae LMG 25204]
MTPGPRIAVLIAGAALAQAAQAENAIDLVRPDAPELAAHGQYVVGVRTLTFTDEDRIDVVNTTAEGTPPVAPREITVEAFYPAAEGTEPGGTYDAILRDGMTSVTLTGMAARDAAPAEGSFPLVVISHGYPGNRFLMAHMGENLASKGYVAVSVDHPDSTYSDLGAFASTLVNRPVDQAFVVESMAALDDDLGAITDAERTGVVGYSMGGYGALIFGGAGVTEAAVTRTEPERFVPPQRLLARNQAGSAEHAALVDPRVKALVAIGPWGRNTDFWDAEGLATLEKPLLLVAGGADDVSEYDSIREIFEETSGTNRHLLTFEGANHNAAAPMPAPAEAWEVSDALGRAPFDHYADAVWDNVRMNNILQHFATVFLDLHLKGDETRAGYLDLVETAEDGTWSTGEDGTPDADHTYWTGFPNRTAMKLRFEARQAE